MSVKKKLLFNDFVIQYSHCNFRCEYCLNQLKPDETSIWKSTNRFNTPSYANKTLDFEYKGELKSNIDKTMLNFQKAIDAPILRISGGEILGMKGIEQLLKEACEQYPIVQIVTNGFYLDHAMAEYIKSLGKIQIHFSLDGHTTDLNFYRVKETTIQQILMNNLDYALALGIVVEISSVLTNRNTKVYESFLQYLMQYAGTSLKVFPAPIRGVNIGQFFPSQDDIRQFDLILRRYDWYESILPPKAYMQNLMDFLYGHEKNKRCWIPLTAIQSLDNGILTACPNGWTSQVANVWFDNESSVVENIKNERIYSLFTQERPRLKYCKECFTAYEIVNLYLNDEITAEELFTVPLYCNDNVYFRLNEIKKERQISGACC